MLKIIFLEQNNMLIFLKARCGVIQDCVVQSFYCLITRKSESMTPFECLQKASPLVALSCPE